MGLLGTLRHITGHPLNRGRPIRAVGRFVRWQVVSRLARGPVLAPFVGETRLSVAAGMTGATGNIYCGLAEFRSMALALHLLRPGELFVDVGANVGAFTILAASTGARCISFEPHAATHEHLRQNVSLNGFEDRVRLVQACVGRDEGYVTLTDSDGPMNHVAATGTTVPLVSLDRSVEGSPTMVKIDVEGFEGEVLTGGAQTIRQALAVSIELGNAGERYGWSEQAIHREMLALGFEHVSYDPFRRRLLDIEALQLDENNTIYVRNRAAVERRVESAPPLRVLGLSI